MHTTYLIVRVQSIQYWKWKQRSTLDIQHMHTHLYNYLYMPEYRLYSKLKRLGMLKKRIKHTKTMATESEYPELNAWLAGCKSDKIDRQTDGHLKEWSVINYNAKWKLNYSNYNYLPDTRFTYAHTDTNKNIYDTHINTK